MDFYSKHKIISNSVAMTFNALTAFAHAFTNLANAVQLTNMRLKKPGLVTLGYLSLALVKT